LVLFVITQAYSQLRPANIEKVKKVEHRIGQSWTILPFVPVTMVIVVWKLYQSSQLEH